MGHPDREQQPSTESISATGTAPPPTWPPVVNPDAAPTRRPRRRWPLIAAALAVLALAAGGVAAYLLTRPAKPANDPTSNAALIASCQDSAKRQLKAPSTAKFSEEWVNQTGPTSWKVIGAVDAQNDFGAMLRQRYVCTAEKAPDRWVLTGVTFTAWS